MATREEKKAKQLSKIFEKLEQRKRNLNQRPRNTKKTKLISIQSNFSCGPQVIIPEAPIFRPSIEEFSDPIKYLTSIKDKFVQFGVCKILPPEGWSPSLDVSNGFTFSVRSQPFGIKGETKDEGFYFGDGGVVNFKTWKIAADKYFQKLFPNQQNLSAQAIENEFWRLIYLNNPSLFNIRYGSDIEGTFFVDVATDDIEAKKTYSGSANWNLNKLPILDGSILSNLDYKIPGVTSPMLYIGQIFSRFCWHTEDNFLYSTSYLHSGASKTWYAVPGEHANGLETIAKREFPELFAKYPNPFFLKTLIFSPQLLLDAHIPVFKVVQAAGEFVVTLPQAYHCGFSHGFNIGEAVNFALDDWFNFGKKAIDQYRNLKVDYGVLIFDEIICKISDSKQIMTLRAKNLKPCFDQVINEELNYRKQFKNQMQFNKLSKRKKKNLIKYEWPEIFGFTKCSYCYHKCYFSVVKNYTINKLYCLKHFLEINQNENVNINESNSKPKSRLKIILHIRCKKSYLLELSNYLKTEN
eukprot:TRINITY_DN725_c3_g1_i2.p1 TRINITY_DN725_c3_g1~~TRINITY_DN725_c3_g1_i2.p1  ORF type:complete len:540 (-),score=187.56 TRINITY_DN725_c3_g1_i2:92-1660(-)